MGFHHVFIIHSDLQVVRLCITLLVNLMSASMGVSVFGDNYIIKIKKYPRLHDKF